jgi:L-malate glycosyltransferase
MLQAPAPPPRMTREHEPAPATTVSVHIDTARGWRGGQSQVLHTVMGLRAAGHRAILVAPADGALFRRMSEGHDLVPLAPRQEIDLAIAWRLARLLRELRPDVVHAHDARAVAMGALALSLGAPAPRPAFVVARRVEFPLRRNAFSRWKYSLADCCIAISAAVRTRLLQAGIPADRIVVVHDGVDVDRIDHLPAAHVHAAFHLPHGAPVVGTVGALTPEKAHGHLIDAAALVVREVPDARFVIIGEGPLRDTLQHRIHRAGLDRHVVLGGFRADVLELTKGFDVFVLSSLHEGLCTALLDAMAASRAAVATAVGGVPEVVVDGATGFLVRPHDHRGMAERIVTLLKDPDLRQRMGAAALARARAGFTVERMIAETVVVYARLAGRPRAADTARRAADG